MGQMMAKAEELDLENIPEGNGHFMNDTPIPEEIMIHIFSHLPDATLVNIISRVCKHWNELSTDYDLWALRLVRNGIKISKNRLRNFRQRWAEPEIQLTLKYLCVHSHRKGFNENLIKNPSAVDKCIHWEITKGGDGIAIETPPVGCDPIPTEANAESCWVTSYGTSIRSQTITLQDFGIYDFMLDILQPTLLISEWICGRFDCSSESNLRIKFKSGSHMLQQVITTVIEKDRSLWQKVALNITYGDVPTGLLSITFQNSGGDRQFWQGHYGAKSTASTLILDIASDTN